MAPSSSPTTVKSPPSTATVCVRKLMSDWRVSLTRMRIGVTLEDLDAVDARVPKHAAQLAQLRE